MHIIESLFDYFDFYTRLCVARSCKEFCSVVQATWKDLTIPAEFNLQDDYLFPVLRLTPNIESLTIIFENDPNDPKNYIKYPEVALNPTFFKSLQNVKTINFKSCINTSSIKKKKKKKIIETDNIINQNNNDTNNNNNNENVCDNNHENTSFNNIDNNNNNDNIDNNNEHNLNNIDADNDDNYGSDDGNYNGDNHNDIDDNNDSNNNDNNDNNDSNDNHDKVSDTNNIQASNISNKNPTTITIDKVSDGNNIEANISNNNATNITIDNIDDNNNNNDNSKNNNDDTNSVVSSNGSSMFVSSLSFINTFMLYIESFSKLNKLCLPQLTNLRHNNISHINIYQLQIGFDGMNVHIGTDLISVNYFRLQLPLLKTIECDELYLFVNEDLYMNNKCSGINYWASMSKWIHDANIHIIFHHPIVMIMVMPNSKTSPILDYQYWDSIKSFFCDRIGNFIEYVPSPSSSSSPSSLSSPSLSPASAPSSSPPPPPLPLPSSSLLPSSS